MGNRTRGQQDNTSRDPDVSFRGGGRTNWSEGGGSCGCSQNIFLQFEQNHKTNKLRDPRAGFCCLRFRRHRRTLPRRPRGGGRPRWARGPVPSRSLFRMSTIISLPQVGRWIPPLPDSIRIPLYFSSSSPPIPHSPPHPPFQSIGHPPPGSRPEMRASDP